MSSNILLENIHKKFISYETYLTNSNSLGLNNESIFAENHMQILLNIIFDWNLINANSIKKQQQGYDLVDISRNIYIQVTADKNHSTKFKSAVSSFKDLNISLEYETTFLVLFISTKANRKLILNVEEGNLNYKAYFIPQLLEKILFLKEEKLQKIDLLLDQLLTPSNFNKSGKTKKVNIIPVQPITEIGSGIYIKREILIDELYAFAQNDNGLLTGGSGHGKSFILEELQRKCYKVDTPCYIIRINELTKGSNEKIGKLLGSNKKWLSALKALHWNGNYKGLLIFDAFDTAKDDSLKLEILAVIRISIKELSGKWNVLTSVRTYDASKSMKLQEVFPQIKKGSDITCRNFSIPDLTEDELELALNSKGLKTIANGCAKGLQKLLRVPYFLKLFEDILDTSDNVLTINTVETEAQLLEVYWKTKLDDSYVDFLYSLTKKLIENDSLVCDKLEFVKTDNSHIFNSLVSLNILNEVAMKRNISFAHNILLEFAVSKYILAVDVEKQVKLIENSPKLPFHFRQSFVYFYSQMWSDENAIFWQHYNHIKQISVPLFRLFHHTIFNYVLVHFYKTPNQILINLIDNDDEAYGNAVRRTLESIRFIRKGILLDQDIDLILVTSKQINIAYLWELGNLIESGIRQFKNEASDSTLKKLSNASYNYLEFVLQQRNGQQGWIIDGSGALFGVPNAANTFQYNKIKIKSLLKRVMAILNEKNFPIRYFSFLTENIEAIITVDEKFGLIIYKTLYYFNETSTEETSMLASATLNMRSNRKQDYGLIHHVLETKYDKLLKIDFDSSLLLGLDIINKFSSGEGYSYKPKPSLIKIDAIESRVKFDSGYYDESDEHGPVSFLNKIFNALTSLEEISPNELVIEKLYLIVKAGGASKIWRRLLLFLATHPKRFLNLSFQILENPGIYECDETLHEAGELIRSVWFLLEIKQKKKIEGVIHELTPFEISYPELGKRKISRILSCIPEGSLTLDKSIKFVSENGIGENPRIVKDRRPIIAQHYQHTPDERMIYAGFNPEVDDDKPIYSLYSELELFNSKFENNNSSAQLKREYKSSLPTLDKLYNDSFRGSFRDELMRHSCELEISRCARILSEVGRKLNLGEQEKIKNIALFYINSPNYIKAVYESGDIKNRYGIGGPSARTEAVKTLQNLYYSFKNNDFLDLILSLMSDNDLVVRYRTLNSLQLFYDADREKFWSKVIERVLIENDGVCIQKIAAALNNEYIITNDLIKVYAYCNSLVQKLGIDEDIPRDSWSDLVATTLRISLRHSRELALDIINKGISIKQFSHNLIYTIRDVLNEYNGKKSYVDELNKGTVLFDILQLQLTFRFGEILRKGLQDSDAIKDDLEIIDLVIQNLYFAYDYDNGNKNAPKELALPEKKALYGKIKPLLDYTANQSLNIEQGFMWAHTGYYFIQLLNKLLPFEPDYILKTSNIIVVCAAKNNFTFDRITLREIVKLTEGIIADHGIILKEKQNFLYLIEILDQFTTSGFEEPIELTWRLKEAF